MDKTSVVDIMSSTGLGAATEYPSNQQECPCRHVTVNEGTYRYQCQREEKRYRLNISTFLGVRIVEDGMKSQRKAIAAEEDVG
jgi:hypothetical protein